MKNSGSITPNNLGHDKNKSNLLIQNLMSDRKGKIKEENKSPMKTPKFN